MRRRHDAGTEGNGRLTADPDEAAVLDQAKQLRLQRRRHVADLVEEERAFARPLGIAEMALLRSGERAFLVAEDLALEKLGRDRRAVHRDEGLGAARRYLVQQPGRHFLARPGLPGDQHRQIVAA